MEKIDVVCVGELLMEFVAKDTNMELSLVSTFTCVPGGAPANVAVGIQRLGSFKAAFVGKLGKDCFGIKLRDTLMEEQVNTSWLCDDENEQTTLVFDSVWHDGHKELCFYRGADKSLREKDIVSMMGTIFEGDASAKCMHYGSISFIDEPGASTQHQILQMAKQEGLMITYDPNYRPTLWPDEATARCAILDGYKYATIAKISQEEWSVATGEEAFERGAQVILDMGVELVIQTKGELGAVATNGRYTVQSPAFVKDIHVVETTGAGDAFMAAVITRLLPEFERLGDSLKSVDEQVVQEALDYANLVAGLACTKPGAIPALPTQDAVNEFLMIHNKQLRQQRHITEQPVTPLTLSPRDLASMIDHTFLKPYGSVEDIEKLCQEARFYGFAMVAVNPAQVTHCVKLLQGSRVRVGAAIGFPLGQNTTDVKVYETRNAIRNGATEIDMVINVLALQAGNLDFVGDEIEQVVRVCREDAAKHIVCKIILETCYLTDTQKIQACELCRDAAMAPDFVKTSTGFGSSGATLEDVKLMRQVVGTKMGVKASGGIRTLDSARKMVAAGANRIGTSSGVSIMQELLKTIK